MAQRTKRAASLPPAPAEAHRLKLESGRRAPAEWELEDGPGAIRRGDAIVTSNSIRTRKIVEAAGADLHVEFI
jgi:hypothetical protein